MVFFSFLKVVQAIITWNLNICWSLVVLLIGLVTLPIRALSALQKEKWVDKQLESLQIELGNLLWSQKELETHLQYAIRERRVLESLLAELEEEHEKAVRKIERLEKEIVKVKHQNLQFRETQGKGMWDFESKDNNKLERQTRSRSEAPSKVADQVQPPTPGDNQAECSTSQTRSTLKYTTLFKKTVESDPTESVDPVIIASNMYTEETLYQRRKSAWLQSLFSALLSLMVGVITWKAEDTCVPLVAALFIVVAMSLKSVIRLFSSITNKPSADMVALLCFNWFLLGNLTYPILPRLARILSPLITKLSTWTGLSHPLGLDLASRFA